MIRVTVTAQRFVFGVEGWEPETTVGQYTEVQTFESKSTFEEHLLALVEDHGMSRELLAKAIQKMRQGIKTEDVRGETRDIWFGTDVREMLDDEAIDFNDKMDLSDAMSRFGDAFENSSLFQD